MTRLQLRNFDDMSIRSASVQSHLSALNSHPRHRESRPFTGASNVEKHSHSATFPSSNLEPATAKDCTRCSLSMIRGSLKDPLSPVSDDPISSPRIWTNSFRWMLSSYIVISLVFFSASLYRGYSASLFTTLHPTAAPQTHPPALSSINFLSPSARLARLVSLHPPPTHFGPFTYSSGVDPHPHEVTACLWALETNLDWVPSWTNRWPGPTSLVVVTRLPLASIHNPKHHPTLTSFLHHPMLNASRLSLHMLYLDPITQEAPNVFLNLARLFAPTRTLLLVPGTPEPPPLSSIPLLSTARVCDPVVVQAATSGLRTGIAADKSRRAALAMLAPMLIPRDHPLWCMERFSFVPAPATPRAADWDACLWQVQLETFGAATINGPTLVGWRWNVEPHSAERAPPSYTLTPTIRRRLDVRYRVETCVLAIKRLDVLSEEWRSGGRGRVGARLGRKSAEKMRWLHEICREWSHGA